MGFFYVLFTLSVICGIEVGRSFSQEMTEDNDGFDFFRNLENMEKEWEKQESQKRIDEDQRKKLAQEELEEQRKKAEEEQRKKAQVELEEQRKKAQEKLEEQRKKAQEELEEQRKKAEEEQRKKAEEEQRKKAEEEQRKKAEQELEEQRKKAQEELEEQHKKAEEEQRKKAEEELEKQHKKAQAEVEEQLRKNKHRNHPRVLNLPKNFWIGGQLPGEEFNLDTFFRKHDINSDGEWEMKEITAIFKQELVIIYNVNNDLNDVFDNLQIMEQTQTTFVRESDTNGDGEVSHQEFVNYAIRSESEEKLEIGEEPQYDEDFEEFV